ncbi:MAG TPA: ATP-binding protein [Phycisphaerae bacterium]|jgi:signal transduction histidine kinase
MRLARKFTVAFLAGMCLVLALSAFLTARREINLFESDMQHDHSTLGHVLAREAASMWETEGEKRALQFVQIADATHDQIKIRWVWLDAPPHSDFAVQAPRAVLEAARPDGHSDVAVWVNRGEGRLYTYVPLSRESVRESKPIRSRLTTDAGAHRALLELSESLDDEKVYVRNTLLRILVTTAIIVALCGGLAMLLGYRLVGQPVHELVDKARRAGGGDFSGQLALPRNDELSELGGALNAMCAQLAQSLEQLRRADRLLTVGKLAAGIAHELGTPLNVVRARAKMIVAQAASDTAGHGTGPIRTSDGRGRSRINEALTVAAQPDAEARELAEESAVNASARVIVEQSDQMTRIIRQLLDFARPRPPQKLAIDLRQVVQRTLALIETIARKRSAALNLLGCETAVPATVDPDQFQQVLSNLIVNGIQAMPKGGKLTVEVGSTATDQLAPPPPADLAASGALAHASRLAFVRVCDEGVGIPPEHLSHLFEPFFTTKDVGEGTGLGLSVSRGIIREHGGWIDVQSQVGAGSCFTVYLPELDDVNRQDAEDAKNKCAGVS